MNLNFKQIQPVEEEGEEDEDKEEQGLEEQEVRKKGKKDSNGKNKKRLGRRYIRGGRRKKKGILGKEQSNK